MAFVVGVFAAGGVIAANHGNHSRYSDHYNHSNHSQYGDNYLRNEISSKEAQVRTKEAEVENLRRNMNENFFNRIEELKREKNYDALDSPYSESLIEDVKENMKSELNREIQQEKNELAEIDRMIARINELELQSKKT